MRITPKRLSLVASVFLVLGVILSINPIVSTIQGELEYRRVIQSSEFLQKKDQEIKNENLIQPNKDYLDPKVKRSDVNGLGVQESPNPLGSGSDPLEKLAPVDESVRLLPDEKLIEELDVIEEKEKIKDEDIDVKDENTVEYTTEDGLKIVEQSVGEKFEEANGELKEIELDPKQDEQSNFINTSEDIEVKYSANLDDGIVLNTDKGELSYKPINGNNVQAKKYEDGLIKGVIYENVWDGVSLMYEFRGDHLKEYILINKQIENPNFEFQYSTGKLSYSEEVKGGLNLELDNGTIYIDPLYVITKKLGLIDKEVVNQEIVNDQVVKISVDSEWLGSLEGDNFPVIIDPTTRYMPIDSGKTAYTSYKTTVFSCGYTSCPVNIGAVQHDGQNWPWRSVVKFNLSELSGKQLLGANLYVQQQYGGGGTDARPINVTWAACLGFHCVPSSGNPWVSSTVTTYGNINVTSLLQWMQNTGNLNGWLILWGDESWTYSYKGLDPYYMELSFMYNNIPNNNASVAYPQNNTVVTNPNQVLKINSATDSDGDALQYNIVLSNSSGTIIQQSGWSGSVSMPIVEGVLEDGQNYTWRAYVKDPYYAHSSPAVTATFKADFRQGKDTNQAYDEAGPFAANLATGNAYTSNSTHSMNALGGSIGLGLEYNSPVLTRQGLSAKYWNNNNWSGSPVLSRIESNIDYNYSTSSPFKGIIQADNFSASWSGYFIAPQTGIYKFGTDADDSVNFYSNGSLLYSASCCGLNWSSNVSLQQGQAYPIEIKFSEIGGGAKIHLRAQYPDSTQKVIPSNELRTAPVATNSNRGLTGKYYLDDGTHDFSKNKQRFLMKNEPTINMNWVTGSPITNGPVDNFLVKYEGYLIIPTTGNYKIGVNSDDGMKLYLDNNLIANGWYDHSPVDIWSNNINLTAGTIHKIVIEYYEKTGGASIALKWDGPVGIGVIDNKYLSPQANVLPNGWDLTLDANGQIPFETLKVRSNGDVVMISSDGTESLYTFSNGGYKPPVNEDGWLVKNSDDTYTFTDVIGTVYIYDSLDNSGSYKLKESSTPYDDKNPAGLKYEYSSIGGTPKLRKIIDGVDNNRYGQLYYEGTDTECSGSSGDNKIPAGYLCGFRTTDGRWTWLHYYLGQLSRLVYPGDAFFDYGYFSDGRISSIRDSGMLDSIAAGLRNGSEQGSMYSFEYDLLGRVNKIYFPSNSGNSALQHTLEYFPNSSKQHLVGAPEPHGFSKYLEFDNLYRTTKLCDQMNLCSLTEWDPNKDIILSTTDAIGLKSTTIYDLDDRPLESYGPAPAAWFGTDRKPLSQYVNQVPKVETKYDEGMTGPSAAFYQVKNNGLFGSPKLHQLGIIKANPSIMSFDYTTQIFPITKETGMDGVGFSLTGKVSFPQNGTYTFKSNSTDGARIFIDDKLIVDNWVNRSATQSLKQGTFVAEANKVYRIRVDWITFNSTPKFYATLSGPGIAETNNWSILKPGFNLPTTNIVYDQQLGNVETKTEYQDPAYGLVSEKTLDPNGLNYSSEASYESPGTGYLRQTSQTSAGGSTTNYSYYGANEQVDNVCTVPNDPSSQAGFVKSKTEPNVQLQNINVVPNPSLETSIDNNPTNWWTENWGNNTASFEYVSGGHTGSKSVKVTVSSYTDGDSKWYPEERAVKPNETYVYKDYYKATVNTDVFLRFTVGPETYSWIYLGTLPSSNDWSLSQFNFTTPVNATHVNSFHVINSVGELWLDDVSITETTPYNMMPNPSFETENGSNPASWWPANWGTNTATLDYQATGYSGGKSVHISMTSFTNGDATWLPAEIPVNPGTVYIYKDMYKASITTYIWVRYLVGSNYEYAHVGTVLAATNWTEASFNFTAPAGASQALVYHLIAGVGELWVDDVSVKKAENLINNPSVEMASTSDPDFWYTNAWGNNTPTFSYVNDSVDGAKSVKVSISNYVDGEAKWYHSETPVTAGKRYTFSSSYKSSVNTAMLVAYKKVDQSIQYIELPAVSASSNWATYSTTLEIPANVTHFTMLHMLRANGELWIDNYSLKEVDDNYKDGIKTEMIYDATGRAVASRINNENWNCTIYDDRGRVQSKIIASNNGKTGKTVTNNFAYGGNPLKRLVTNGETTIISEYDFVGNLIKYTDAYGLETVYTYDSLNRLIKKESNVGKEEWAYNDYSQVTSKEYNDVVYANVSYDSYGRVSGITYPEAGQLAYLGTTRDALDRPIKYSWRQSDGKLIDEELVKSQSGLILEQEFTHDSTVYTQSYTFDKADRLIAADYGDRQYTYSYATASNCGFQNSNKNFNRTSDSFTIGGVTTTNNYCYDNADKLVSSTQFGSPEYDSHGNTTRLGNLTFGYDISDQNTSITEGWRVMAYSRDVNGRPIWRHYNDGDEFFRYQYSSNSSSPDIVIGGYDWNNIVEKNISLPGMMMTIKPTGEEYSIMSSTGNVLAKETGSLKRYDPFGSPIDNTEKYGFGGSQLRENEFRFSVDFIQMGARVYIPSLGRFLQVDPIEGGTQNDYVYPVDPVNSQDFSGKAIPILAIIGAALIISEVVDLVGMGIDSHNCGNGDQAACENASLGITLNMLPGPSLVWLKKGYQKIDNMANARRLGTAGEQIIKSEYDIGGKIAFVLENGKKRIPDGVNFALKTLSEVKNVKKQGLTQQLRDYEKIANMNGFSFNLYVSGQISKPLKKYADSNSINIIYFKY